LKGHPDKALTSSNQSLELARQLSHGPSLVHALFHAVWLDQFRRDPVSAYERAEALTRLATDQGQFMYVAVGSIFMGWVLTEHGEAEAGIRQMRKGVDDFRSTGARNWVPYYAAILANALWRAGDNEEASVVLRDAQESAKSASDRFFWEA
jgi:predicted ATPase